MLCGTSSRFVQVTVAPDGTVAAAGEKLKLSTTTWRASALADAAAFSSGTSVMAIGWWTSWQAIDARPSIFFSRSASTFIGPGDAAVPGAGCGNAVDIAVWNVTFPSTFCIN